MPTPMQITVVDPDRLIRVVYDSGDVDMVYPDPADWPDLQVLVGTPVHAIQWRRGDPGSHIEPVDGQPIALTDDAVDGPVLSVVLSVLANQAGA